MIAAWIFYAIVFGALVGGGGLAAERVLRTHGLPTRGVWLGVLLLSVGWPLGHWVWENRPQPAPEPVPVLALPEGAAEPSPAVLPVEALTVEVPPESILRLLDGPIMVAWALASGVLLLFFGFVVLRTDRLRRRWREGEADGHPVFYSREWGPAVVGFIRPRIVLPWWCRDMDHRALRLILDHELEHVRAGDLRLIMLVGILPVLFPWHLPLWWQLASLRTAVEGDCDLRVLRKNPGQTRPYVGLLLDVGERISRRPLLTAMLSEPYATLKRRIKVMTMPFPKRPWIKGGVMVGVGGFLVLLACWAPSPVDAPEGEGPADPDAQGEAGSAEYQPASDLELTPAVFTPYVVRPGIKNVDEVVAGLRGAYPTSLKEEGLGGTARVWFFLNEDAEVVNVQLAESSGYPELDDVVIRSAGLFQFTPALNRDRKTPVWVSLPILFAANGEAPDVPNEPRARQSTRRIGVPLPAGGMEALTGLPQSEISGVVRDAQSGMPLQHVQIYVPGTQQGTMTNEDGRFVIPHVPSGTREVVALLVGYGEVALGIEVPPGERLETEFALQAAAIGYTPLVVPAGGGVQ